MFTVTAVRKSNFKMQGVRKVVSNNNNNYSGMHGDDAKLKKTKFRGFSPQANDTDRATDACRRS
jgi:hypothetical protein